MRPSHAKYEGLIVSINDPFLATHSTPFDWGCRCEWVQTDEPVNKQQDQYKDYKEIPLGKGFDFNPGVDQTLFSESAGYYTNVSKSEAEKLTREADSFASLMSKQAVRQQLRKVSNNYAFSKVKGFKNITLSNRDIKDITTGFHESRPLRNALLFDLKNVLKEAVFMYSKAESKGRDKYMKWYYYKVKGYDNMYLNMVEMRHGELKLHAITDKLKKK